ncbi:NAC domain-containing protein 104 [Camellia lanceoleosa]|uniref:NAC domain-containing protein 104 n=1 Tax=Camellia lanceoleosa TaxID=1840588 RepID=A0ACC0FT30_9ERIC|nr:NAC domain-containing protein 104 [Camellia lanceoleosa]
MGDKNVNLPPGFRFYPTDEELVVHFLHRKAALLPCHPDVIPDLDLYPYDPWDLDGKAMAEGNKWYFFSRKTQNRVTGNGYWKPLGLDEPIFSSGASKKVGMKKYYVFYVGEAPAGGAKTNWIMQEYRLSDSGSSSTSSSRSSRSSKRRGNPKIDYSKWVVCRVYERNCDDDDNDGTELSCMDEVFLALDDLDEISLPN